MTTLDLTGLSPAEYRAVLDKMGVENNPEPGIYLHLSVPTDFGYRIVEIWDSKEGFDEFAQERMYPVLTELGIDRDTAVTIRPLHNLFAPRLPELPGFIAALPGDQVAVAHGVRAVDEPARAVKIVTGSRAALRSFGGVPFPAVARHEETVLGQAREALRADEYREAAAESPVELADLLRLAGLPVAAVWEARDHRG